MNLMQATIGYCDLVICEAGHRHYRHTRPITANAPTEKGVTAMQTNTVPELTTADLERALRDALVKQFEKRGPTGQVVTEAPPLERVFPDTKELIYRHEAKYWKAPYLLNSDQTATIGVGVPVAKTWTTLSAMQRRDLEQAVIESFKVLKAAGDLDPVIKEVRAKDEDKGSAVVLFSGAYHELPFWFDGKKCWVGSPRPVERDGASFRPPSNMTGLDVVAMTDKIVATVKELGRQIRYGDAQIIAAQLQAQSWPTTKRELEPFLGKVFAMIAEEERRHSAKRGGTR